ncbi:MAG: fumarylacetoacetate hydrolase family protein [Salinivirgaceae bacterium]|jgi:2-keto-4-pentenoate hydratase/2-oxohepta-3-ene-1,7-dioic acid hydratase in catechol pathway|nr:fumarylacetoacetate hydrolase family protein [Bacteroidales bacterium]
MKTICIVSNYAESAKEQDNQITENPIFFLKPETALLRKNQPFFYPEFSKNIHHEVELVYRICRVGKNISQRFAHRYYDAVGVGVSFTARDILEQCKTQGLPWEIAKAFDNSTAISDNFIEIAQLPNINEICFRLERDSAVVQHGKSSEMIFNIDKIIAYVSKFVMLKIGDLIFTGTPAGTGNIEIGDNFKAYIDNNLMLTTKIC